MRVYGHQRRRLLQTYQSPGDQDIFDEMIAHIVAEVVRRQAVELETSVGVQVIVRTGSWKTRPPTVSRRRAAAFWVIHAASASGREKATGHFDPGKQTGARAFSSASIKSLTPGNVLGSEEKNHDPAPTFRVNECIRKAYWPAGCLSGIRAFVVFLYHFVLTDLLSVWTPRITPSPTSAANEKQGYLDLSNSNTSLWHTKSSASTFSGVLCQASLSPPAIQFATGKGGFAAR